MFGVILIIIAAGLLAFAIWSNWKDTDPTKSPAQRTWAAILAAIMAGAAYVASFFTTPPAGLG